MFRIHLSFVHNELIDYYTISANMYHVPVVVAAAMDSVLSSLILDADHDVLLGVSELNTKVTTVCSMSVTVVNEAIYRESSPPLTYTASSASVPAIFRHSSRINFGSLLVALGYHMGTTVEVGVYRGSFSANLIRGLGDAGGTHILVDPWIRQDVGDNADIVNEHYHENNTVFEDAMRAVSNYGSRIVAIKATSSDAAAVVLDGSVDFVYIDAQHGYYNCMLDLRLWWHKVKPNGGVFAGHDYDCFGGVSGAVDEFSRKMNITIHLTDDVDYGGFNAKSNTYNSTLSTCRSWYMLK